MSSITASKVGAELSRGFAIRDRTKTVDKTVEVETFQQFNARLRAERDAQNAAADAAARPKGLTPIHGLPYPVEFGKRKPSAERTQTGFQWLADQLLGRE